MQDNHSRSHIGVLRGLHYQLNYPQGKLIRVANGRALDVAVDIRVNSPTFGEHVAVEVSSENHKQLWIPPGCAHGFVALSDSLDFLYKTTEFHAPNDEYCILWNDQDLGIDWQLGDVSPKLSDKDQQGQEFRDAPKYL